MKTAIIVISEAGIALAKTLEQELPESEIFSTGTDTDCHSISNLQEAVPEIFHKFDAIIFIGAMGICIRAIAPHIEDKHKDPAVVCVDSTGRYAVSVLSGHIGGANGLTRYVASILGAEPVITTRSDRTGLWALDTLGKKYGWQTVPAESSDMNHLITLFVDCKPTALLLDSWNIPCLLTSMYSTNLRIWISGNMTCSCLSLHSFTTPLTLRHSTTSHRYCIWESDWPAMPIRWIPSLPI